MSTGPHIITCTLPPFNKSGYGPEYACQARDSRFSKDRIDLERVAICRNWPASWLPEGGTAATMSCYICSSLSPSTTEKSNQN